MFDRVVACNLIIPLQRHSSQYPVLSRIARDYLAIQGSAVASERVFSSAALTDTNRRNQLAPEMLGALQRLKDAILDGRISAETEAGQQIGALYPDYDLEQA